jgi:hypothetical protein
VICAHESSHSILGGDSDREREAALESALPS